MGRVLPRKKSLLAAPHSGRRQPAYLCIHAKHAHRQNTRITFPQTFSFLTQVFVRGRRRCPARVAKDQRLRQRLEQASAVMGAIGLRRATVRWGVRSTQPRSVTAHQRHCIGARFSTSNLQKAWFLCSLLPSPVSRSAGALEMAADADYGLLSVRVETWWGRAD